MHFGLYDEVDLEEKGGKFLIFDYFCVCKHVFIILVLFNSSC